MERKTRRTCATLGLAGLGRQSTVPKRLRSLTVHAPSRPASPEAQCPARFQNPIGLQSPSVFSHQPNLARCTTDPAPELPSQPTCGSPASKEDSNPTAPGRRLSASGSNQRAHRPTTTSLLSLTPAIASWPPDENTGRISAPRQSSLPRRARWDHEISRASSRPNSHQSPSASPRPPSPRAGPANDRTPFLGEPDLPESRSRINGPALAPGPG